MGLGDALWAHQTAYKTSTSMSPYEIVFGKPCRLPIELVHQSYWAVKNLNLSMDEAGTNRKLDIQELEEIRNDAYENEAIYKEKMKAFHDKMISQMTFTTGQKVLLYHSIFKPIYGK